MMNKEWIGERGAVLDIKRALKNGMLGGDDFGFAQDPEGAEGDVLQVADGRRHERDFGHPG